MGRVKLVGPTTEYIAGELRAQQARRSWTLDDIVERTGVARSSVDRALKGKSALSVEVLIPLAAGMEVDLGALLKAAGRRS